MFKTNQHVESVAVTHCFMSEKVNSRNWRLLHESCVNELNECCPNIRSLKLNSLQVDTDEFNDEPVILLPKLTHLHLSHNHYLKPEHMKSIASICSNLAQLWVTGEIFYGNKEDWEDAFCTLLQKCWRTLTHLQFDAFLLRDKAFKVLKYLYMYV